MKILGYDIAHEDIEWNKIIEKKKWNTTIPKTIDNAIILKMQGSHNSTVRAMPHSYPSCENTGQIFTGVECHNNNNMEANMPYTTYENRTNPHITIHRNGCNQIQKNGGGRGEYKYHSSLSSAEAYAESTGLPVINCSFCNP